jgi:hypothetical protein
MRRPGATWPTSSHPKSAPRSRTLNENPKGRIPAGTLLEYARNDIEERLADIAYGGVAAPAGANWVGKWEKNQGEGWSRSLVWRDYRGVSIDGRQQCDGSVERQISLYLGDYPTLSRAQAREFAAVLVEAADELDRLS